MAIERTKLMPHFNGKSLEIRQAFRTPNPVDGGLTHIFCMQINRINKAYNQWFGVMVSITNSIKKKKMVSITKLSDLEASLSYLLRKIFLIDN